MNHHKGFSLIEAIFSLAIISLLTLNIIPQLNQILIKYKEKEQYVLMQQILLEELIYSCQHHMYYHDIERYPYVISISPHHLFIKHQQKNISISYEQ